MHITYIRLAAADLSATARTYGETLELPVTSSRDAVPVTADRTE